MGYKIGKKGKGFLMVGLLTAGMIVFFVSGAYPPSTPVARPISPVAKVARKKKTTSIRSGPMVPVSRPSELLVTFPEPTSNTILVARAPQYVKISHTEGELISSASEWDCVEDKTTGLIWEKKTQDRGLRDAKNFYSWYNPDPRSNGGHAGVADSGKCQGGIGCDTDAYIKAVNELKLCGFSDWRLPTRADLMSLVQYSERANGKGLINKRYFPSAPSDWYWAANSDDLNPERAWYVLFYNGRYMKAPKSEAKRIRLVRTRTERSMRNMAQTPTTVAAKPEAFTASRSAIASGS